MLNQKEILSTIRMIEHQHLDIRTITMGISLLSCADEEIHKACTKIYDRICFAAKDLVRTGEDIENEFGIRHENMMVCHKAEKTDAGQFMEFETLTLVPFDLEGVLPEMMTERERALLNAYHEKVYEKIAPHLNEEERAWLKEATRAI